MTIGIRESTENEYLKIARAITKFNLEHLPSNSSNHMTSLGYVVHDDVAGVVGGIYGKLLLGNCLSIDILWVDKKFRNLGHATNLVQKLENIAIQLGSHLSIVDTFDFQALEFYQKCNYEVFGVLDDCPCAGNKRYYLKKPLRAFL
jgi:ribosomal protein S18 acetylase RimI-like enzyme